jgi:hypothetical protein
MPLSVLSALARLGFDPWQEAAELARLPLETATRRLASSIAVLPDRPSAYLEHGTIAARLIALLPRHANSNVPSRETPVDAGDVTKFRAGVCMYVVLIVFMLAAQWLEADRQTQVDDAHVPDARAVLPQTPPSNSAE